MLKFMSFSSGSCGNCYYLGTERTGLLIDAGVSLRKLKRIFPEAGIDPDRIAAVLVTHEHLDHIRFLGSFCKRMCIPVYTTKTIHDALAVHSFTAPVIAPCRRVLEADCPSVIDGMEVTPFVVPHDAKETVGYSILAEGHRFVIMTDIGKMTDEALAYASQADTLVIESNYDVDMLLGGSYTYELKMRIMQGSGHLSNDECASALRRVWHSGLKNVFLCHLSANNNTQDSAYRASFESLALVSGKGTAGAALHCLPRETPSEMFLL